jgi:hypothetical protein
MDRLTELKNPNCTVHETKLLPLNIEYTPLKDLITDIDILSTYATSIHKISDPRTITSTKIHAVQDLSLSASGIIKNINNNVKLVKQEVQRLYTIKKETHAQLYNNILSQNMSRLKKYMDQIYVDRSFANDTQTKWDDMTRPNDHILQEQEQLNQNLENTIIDISDRHNEILELERNIKEVYELFNEMALLVNTQGEIIDNIETHVKKGLDMTEKGFTEITIAETYQNKARENMCCILIIVLIVLLIFSGIISAIIS